MSPKTKKLRKPAQVIAREPIPGTWASTHDAARFCGISKQTLAKYRFEGSHPELVFKRVSRRKVVYSVDAILKYLNTPNQPTEREARERTERRRGSAERASA